MRPGWEVDRAHTSSISEQGKYSICDLQRIVELQVLVGDVEDGLVRVLLGHFPLDSRAVQRDLAGSTQADKGEKGSFVLHLCGGLLRKIVVKEMRSGSSRLQECEERVQLGVRRTVKEWKGKESVLSDGVVILEECRVGRYIRIREELATVGTCRRGSG